MDAYRTSAASSEPSPLVSSTAYGGWDVVSRWVTEESRLMEPTLELVRTYEVWCSTVVREVIVNSALQMAKAFTTMQFLL